MAQRQFRYRRKLPAKFLRALRRYLGWAGLSQDTRGRDVVDIEAVYRMWHKLRLTLLQALGHCWSRRRLRDFDPSFFSYRVPPLDANDCSVVGAVDPRPYNLAGALGGRTLQTARFLFLVRELFDVVYLKVKPDWIGVYLLLPHPKRGLRLVKLVYFGRPSRAEFPATRAFAKRSLNSTVVRDGQGWVIYDVSKFNGPYYTCDDRTAAEACLPIFGARRRVRPPRADGIIDSEHTTVGFYTKRRVAMMIALAMVLPEAFKLRTKL